MNDKEKREPLTANETLSLLSDVSQMFDDHCEEDAAARIKENLRRLILDSTDPNVIAAVRAALNHEDSPMSARAPERVWGYEKWKRDREDDLPQPMTLKPVQAPPLGTPTRFRFTKLEPKPRGFIMNVAHVFAGFRNGAGRWHCFSYRLKRFMRIRDRRFRTATEVFNEYVLYG